ncbi:hypothetical protein UCDDS831_g06287 [Diplodia seriata]|uniref:Uncharacterized protein n=1 Tax=Diplodia seriata TaxID=420778 RepID=A0A0G2E4B8_9PEZI|nr:hypothetical protein UCDDS831_g06287 [Diplodia seriata]
MKIPTLTTALVAIAYHITPAFPAAIPTDNTTTTIHSPQQQQQHPYPLTKRGAGSGVAIAVANSYAGAANAISSYYQSAAYKSHVHAHALGLHCRIPGRGNVFVYHKGGEDNENNNSSSSSSSANSSGGGEDNDDRPATVTFNIHTPWTLTYGARVLERLRQRGWEEAAAIVGIYHKLHVARFALIRKKPR